jgi:hypothetical protein
MRLSLWLWLPLCLIPAGCMRFPLCIQKLGEVPFELVIVEWYSPLSETVLSAGSPKVDPKHLGKLDPDSHPHQSEKMEVLEGHLGALEGLNLKKASGRIRMWICITLKGRIRFGSSSDWKFPSNTESLRIRHRDFVKEMNNPSTAWFCDW